MRLERPWVLVCATSFALTALGCGRASDGHVAVTSAECVVCHLDTYEATTMPHHVPPAFPTTCADCHSTSAWIPAIGGGQSDTSDPARDLTIDAQIPRFSGTSIATLTPQTETLTNPMVHASAAIDPAASASCTNCHSGVGSLYPGTFHASLIGLSLPQPTTCNDCHSTATLPTGFVGPFSTTPARVPASGPMRHEAVLWASGAPTTTAIVDQDCGTCHAPPSAAAPTASWSPAFLHASLTSAGIAQPTSCLDCHANSRPDHPIDSTNSTLPAGRLFDHAVGSGLDDCTSCHASTSTWSGGIFHHPGDTAPTSCTHCHDGERPTSTAGWTSTTYTSAPFDYGTNLTGVTHGAGQDCNLCHSAPASAADSWVGGHFDHAVARGIDATSCVACHASQRPDLALGSAAAAAALLPGSFDHALNGSGDCFGCHQASVTAGRYTAYFNGSGTLPGGDWAGGTEYPGAFVSSTSVHVTVTETTLHRTGTLVTSMTTASTAYYNGMLHTSAQVPAELTPGASGTMPDYTTCWHCHTSTGTMVTSYVDGRFHTALDQYTVNPGDPVTPLAQPSTCSDCHAQMRPRGIVERAGSVLEPMDHAAAFVRPVSIGGTMASSVADVDCSVCHTMPGGSWSDGAFHSRIGAAEPADCTSCHFPAMADAPHADLTSGTTYAMRHRSVQMTFQNCSSCHPSALGRATSTPSFALWNDGSFHAHTTSTPTGCVDCHTVSEPTVTTRSASGQYMSHRASYVTGRDCVACHTTDASSAPRAWSRTTPLHGSVATGVTTCQECHGRTNGLGGTSNDMPATITNATEVTSASAPTGVAGMHDQIDHTDVNVTGHDCNFCHTQVGPAAGAGGWTQGSVHAAFASGRVAMILSPMTGRCSHCHANLTPTVGFTAFNHTTIGTSDCASCHSWPGTGTTAMANWLGAMGGAPATIPVGGFTIPSPPAATPTIQSGISGLTHPATGVPGGPTCVTCHGPSGGGRGAVGYDHAPTPASAIANRCNTCHEAGSDLVNSRLVWNGTSGDTRPFTLASVRASFSGNSSTVTYPNHFYPVDCDECHNAPAGVATGTTGAAFTTAWRFDHNCRSMTPVRTCLMCHTRTVCG